MFNLNTTYFAKKPFGEYNIKLATSKEDREYARNANEASNPWSLIQLGDETIEGIYVNPENKSAIVRAKIVDGDFADAPPFTIYVSEIDMSNIIQAIMRKCDVNKITAVDALKKWQETPIKFYHYNELGKNKDGQPTLYEKWRTFKSASATEETDVNAILADRERDDL